MSDLTELTDTELDAVGGGFLPFSLPNIQTNVGVNVVGFSWGNVTQQNWQSNNIGHSLPVPIMLQ